MRIGHLTYDGTTYRLAPAQLGDLLARGVIVASPLDDDEFELAPDHQIGEVEQVARSATFQAGDDARGESTSGDDDRRHYAVRLRSRNGFGGNR